MPFKYARIHKAHYGEPGKSQDKYGKNADDLTLYVPLGTVVKNRHTGHVLFVGDQVLEQPFMILK
jgi:GTP-binding protein